jgi:hypothetical protein
MGSRIWHLKEYPGSIYSIALAVALVMTMLNIVMIDRASYGVIVERDRQRERRSERSVDTV